MRRRSKTNATKTRNRKRAAIKRHRTPDSRHHSSHRPGQPVDQLRRELDEAREQQAATTDVLRIVSASSGEVKPVFQAILSNAVRICEAKFGILALYEGDNVFRAVATHNLPVAHAQRVAERGERLGFRAHPLSSIGRVAATKRVVHVFDYREELAYKERDPVVVDAVELGRARTIVSVPMLKQDTLIGAIVIYRQEVRPFTDKQIALVQNFAAQAVIAIENARLLNELRQRTADLSASLEQQTATSEVLQVISSSPAQLEPVFETMLANATRICEAKFGILYRCEGDALRTVAMHDAPQPFVEARRSNPIVRPNPDTTVGRAMATKQPLQIANILEELDPLDARAAQLPKLAGARTVLAVPMLKENELVGVFVIYRTEVRPFNDKQIALLQNFAAQAVIAIENTRLFNELRERTEEVVKLNQQLEMRVADQVNEIERMGRLRRFLPQQVADLIVASGTEKQLESHRREITALFCDLRGFTGFSESSDPEDVMALLRDYHAAIGEIIIKYSGTLERFAGDGVMVIF